MILFNTMLTPYNINHIQRSRKFNLTKAIDHGRRNQLYRSPRVELLILTLKPSDNQPKTRPAIHETMILNAGDALNSTFFATCHFFTNCVGANYFLQRFDNLNNVFIISRNNNTNRKGILIRNEEK